MWEEIFDGQVVEIKNSPNVSYILKNNEMFYDIGYRVMRNQENDFLLPCHRLKYNGKLKLVYFTEEYTTIRDIFLKMEPEKIGLVIANLFETILWIEDNGFLDVSCIDNRLEKILIDSSNYKVKLLYLPVNMSSGKKSRNIFENEIRAGLVKLLQNRNVSADERIDAVIDVLTDATLRVKEVVGRLKKAKSFGARIEMPAEVHNAGQRQYPLLLYAVDGSLAMQIENTEYLIGKSNEKADGTIMGNPAISRVHCKILFREGAYYILDMGSANGTFVNNIRVGTSQPVLITAGTIVRLANMEFIVRR